MKLICQLPVVGVIVALILVAFQNLLGVETDGE